MAAVYGVPSERFAIFCHSSCGVWLRPDTTDAELEYLGTVNLLHKKWEVLLKAALRLKFTNAMAHVARSSTAEKRPTAKGKKQPRKKVLKEGLAFADFDAAGAAPDF